MKGFKFNQTVVVDFDKTFWKRKIPKTAYSNCLTVRVMIVNDINLSELIKPSFTRLLYGLVKVLIGLLPMSRSIIAELLYIADQALCFPLDRGLKSGYFSTGE